MEALDPRKIQQIRRDLIIVKTKNDITVFQSDTHQPFRHFIK
ncbi:MAG TPA: hypothetical protein ENL02_00385 [Epsilonproteobacteria bacterium]|nr:hypothetical protein [Campylobacterota bacterium]